MAWALSLPMLIGAVALSTDVGSWYFSKRNLQNAVDAAAIATGYNLTGSNPQQSTMYYTASNEMTRNGLGASQNVTLTVNYTPTSGAYAGNPQAVELTATQPQSRFFTRMFLSANPNVSARAVALRQPSGSACVLALSNTGSSTLLFQGNTTINLNGCSAAANSTDSEGIYLSGSSVTNTYNLYTAGGYGISGGATLNTTEPSVTNGTPITDPFSTLTVPSYSGCNSNNYNANNTATINPGVYCNGMSFGSHANITMNPGVYIVDRGTFRVNAGAVLTGTGVTIILTSSTGSSYATVTINGGATVTLSAPTSGTWEGILFYQDRNAPIATNTNRFNGGSSTNYVGAIYFPKQEVEFSGNNTAGGGACTKIVANTITFTGNSSFSNTCPGSVARIATQGVVQLVE